MTDETVERLARELTWAEETMLIINKLTPNIKGKGFDPDWFMLRQRFEQFEARESAAVAAARLEEAKWWMEHTDRMRHLPEYEFRCKGCDLCRRIAALEKGAEP